MSATKEFDVESWKRNLREADPTDDDACIRWFNDYFAFWFVCATKACKRTKRCAGDAGACSARMMPLVPQRMKFELQATLKAMNERLPREAMMRRVEEETARFDETARVLERLGHASPPSPRPAGGEKPSGGERKAAATRGPQPRMC